MPNTIAPAMTSNPVITAAAAITLPTGTVPTSTRVGASRSATPKIAAWITNSETVL